MAKKKTKKKCIVTPHEVAFARMFYEKFAEENGCTLDDFKFVGDVFGDGVPQCITVFKKKGAQ